MPLEDERNAYILVGKRILKSRLSKNPATLEAYKRDIIVAHNRFVDYVISKFETASDRSKEGYRKNLKYVQEKTNDCFVKLKINYQFADNPFEFIDETKVISSGEGNPNNSNSDSEDTDPFDNDLDNSDDNKENENNRDNDNINEMDVAQFLAFASRIVPEFDGTYANLQSFIDALNLANASVGAHVVSYVAFIKSRLKINARSCVTNEATVADIILALQANIKPESASLIESKMMNIHQSKKKANDYVKEIETLAADLKRAHMTDGIPIAAADNLATNSAVKALRQNASSEKVKMLMEAGTFRNLNEAVDKFVTLSTTETPNNSNNATINYMNRRQGSDGYRSRRYNNRGYRKNNYQSNSYNYRPNNRRGYGNRGYYRSNDNRRGNNRRPNHVRYIDAETHGSNSGNQSGPQQILLRDA